MQRIRPAWFVLLLLVVLFASCFRTSGDAPMFPKPVSGRACPDLTGTFRFQADPESQAGWTDIIRTRIDLGGPATHVSVFDSTEAHVVTLVLHRESAEFLNAVANLRAHDAAAYGEWRRRALALFDPMRGELKVRHELPFDSLVRLGPVPEWGVREWKGHCVDGWYRDARDNDAEVWMTRDVEGGLLVRFDQTERKVISLWAETGAGIPYAIHTHSRWARFAPADAPDLWHPSTETLPPAIVASGSDDPPGFLQKDADARVAGLRSRARALMGADAMLLNFKEEGGRVLFTGTLPDRAALDRLLAALPKEPEIANVKLEHTMDMSFGRIRFVLYLQLRR